MKVSAVIVSHMDRAIGEVTDSVIPYVHELIVVKGLAGVAERWDRALHAKNEIVYTQDDDAIVDVAAVLESYRPGVVTCNMPEDRRPEYQDGCALVGWGAVFDRKLVDVAFRRYWMYAHHHAEFEKFNDEVFRSECDRIFTGLSTLNLVDVPFTHCEVAHGKDRMGRRPNHGEMRRLVRERIERIRSGR